MLRDENGKLSSTRIILMASFVIFAVAAFTDIFSTVDLDGQIYNIIQTIFGLGLGGQAVRSSIKNYKGADSGTES